MINLKQHKKNSINNKNKWGEAAFSALYICIRVIAPVYCDHLWKPKIYVEISFHLFKFEYI